MQISQVNDSPNFKELYTYGVVYPKSVKLVKNELPKLKELGEKYDVVLYSKLDSFFDTEYLTATVNHLGETPTFWQRLLGKTATTTVAADYCRSVESLVNRAIAILNDSN